jgi:cytochrome P450
MLKLTRFGEVREALRQDDLRQALYDQSPLTRDALISLHGEDHRRRRRAEQPVFAREALQGYEQSLHEIARETLAPFVSAGRCDLMQFGREVAVNLATTIAGIDRTEQSRAETLRLLVYIVAFSESATVANSRRDPGEVTQAAEDAWRGYLDEFLEPSIARRKRLLAAPAPPATASDIVTTMLRHGPAIGEAALRHEATLYMTASVGTAPGVLVATFDELRQRWAGSPAARAPEAVDLGFLQSAAWETIRLHPANPQHLRRADVSVRLSTGRVIEKDQVVFLDVVAANRDPEVFGAGADRFQPGRSLPAGVAPWGLGFGAGIHVCMGQNLAGGTDSLFGMLAVMLAALLEHGPEIDPEDPPASSNATTRRTWTAYPVTLSATA